MRTCPFWSFQRNWTWYNADSCITRKYSHNLCTHRSRNVFEFACARIIIDGWWSVVREVKRRKKKKKEYCRKKEKTKDRKVERKERIRVQGNRIPVVNCTSYWTHTSSRLLYSGCVWSSPSVWIRFQDVVLPKRRVTYKILRNKKKYFSLKVCIFDSLSNSTIRVGAGEAKGEEDGKKSFNFSLFLHFHDEFSLIPIVSSHSLHNHSTESYSSKGGCE